MLEDRALMKKSDLMVLNKEKLSKSLRKVNSVKYLDYKEVMSVINEVDVLRDRMLLTFLLNTGLRVSEALSVCKRDVDLKAGSLVVVWLKKRKKKQRVIPINSKLVGVLAYYMANLNNDDKLFDITRQRAYVVCRRWLGVNPHTLRHSFAVFYRKSGGRLEDLSSLLGHSSLQMTMIYSSISPDELKREVDRIEW